jgi:anti-sigma B factor antagonist
MLSPLQPPPDTADIPATGSVASSDVVVVAPERELDLETAPALCARLAGARAGRVLLDLGAVGFCDSSGLRTIIGAAQETAIHRGRFVVVAPPDSQPARMLALTGLQEFLTIVGDREAGFERLLRGRRTSPR